MRGIIYKITNTITGESYIGQSLKTLEKRWAGHLSPSSGCTYLKNAIVKYGKDVFSLETLETVQSQDGVGILDTLNELEIKYISEYRTKFPSGYNLMDGGKNAYKPRNGRTKGWKRSPESIAKFVVSKTGTKYGPKTPEQVKRSADGHKKPVKCLETGETWASVSECAEHFKVKPKQVSRVLKGQRKRLKRAYTLVYWQS